MIGSIIIILWIFLSMLVFKSYIIPFIDEFKVDDLTEDEVNKYYFENNDMYLSNVLKEEF